MQTNRLLVIGSPGPRGPVFPCLRDYRDHSPDMQYGIMNNMEINTVHKTKTSNFREKDVTRPGSVQEKTGDICVPVRFECVLLGLLFLDPGFPVGVVSV